MSMSITNKSQFNEMQSQWSNFSYEELACQHCGSMNLSEEFLIALQELRSAYGKPMKITSGYRCPDHEIEKRKPNGPGTHCEPGAIDVAVSGEDAWNLIDIASSHRWGGIGVNTPSFVHLDRRTNKIVWKY